MGLEDIANLVGGLTSAAQGYMSGQEWAMKRQMAQRDQEAQEYTLLLKNKQIELEAAKANAEMMKLPYEIDKLRAEAEKARAGDKSKIDESKMFSWDVLKTLDNTNMSPLLKGYQEHGLKNNLTGDFTVPEIIKDELLNSYKMQASKIDADAKLAEEARKRGSELTEKAGKIPLEAMKKFREDKSIGTAITTLDQIKVGLADAFDEKGKFRNYEKRIKEDKEKNVLGSVGMMQRLLAKVSDPNSAVRDLEEANMASKGSPVLDRIRAIIGGKVTGDVTKEEYDMMTFLVSKYVKGNVDILENTAKNMLPSLQSESKALKEAGAYYPGSNVKAREISYDDLVNSIPSLQFLKNADLPTAKKDKATGSAYVVSQTNKQTPKTPAAPKNADKVVISVGGVNKSVPREWYEKNKNNPNVKLVGSK